MRSRLVLAGGTVRRDAERKGKQRGRGSKREGDAEGKGSRGEGDAEGKGKKRRASRGEGDAERKGKQRGREAEANGRELRETAYKTEDCMFYRTWERGRGREGREIEHWTRCFWVIQNKQNTTCYVASKILAQETLVLSHV